MTITEYQKQANSFENYKDKKYPYYLLAEEVGEFFGKLAKKKTWRLPILSKSKNRNFKRTRGHLLGDL